MDSAERAMLIGDLKLSFTKLYDAFINLSRFSGVQPVNLYLKLSI